MKKPDPGSASIITHDFEDLQASLMPLDDVERLKQDGPLLFTQEDVNASSDLLVHEFRQLCVEEHITQKYFEEKYKIYAIAVLGKTPQAAMNNKANIVKMLQNCSKLTWKKFIELTHLVLGFKPEIVNIIFRKVKSKEEIKISTRAAEVSAS